MPENSPQVHSVEIKIRYTETDAMGFVHHSHYYNYFEVARVQAFEDLGHPYQDMEKKDMKKLEGLNWIDLNQILAIIPFLKCMPTLLQTSYLKLKKKFFKLLLGILIVTIDWNQEFTAP